MNQLEHLLKILLIFSTIFKDCQSSSVYYVPFNSENITLPCPVGEIDLNLCYWTHKSQNVTTFSPFQDISLPWKNTKIGNEDCDIILKNVTQEDHGGSWTCSFISLYGQYGQHPTYNLQVSVITVVEFHSVADEIQ